MMLSESHPKTSTLHNNQTELNENLPEHLNVKTMKEMPFYILTTPMPGFPFIPKLTTQDNYNTNSQ